MPQFGIERFENLAFTPAWTMVPAAQAELIASGFNQVRGHGPSYNDGVIIASEAFTNEVAGFMSFQHRDYHGELFITLTYVVPKFRRMGIHTMMFRGLVQHASSRPNILGISSGTHVNNIPAQKAFEKQGRYKSYVSYEYDIRSFEIAKPMEQTEDTK